MSGTFNYFHHITVTPMELMFMSVRIM